MTTAPPKLSLVVCTIGRTEHLRRLLGSLRRQTVTDFEVLIVDQNPPGTLDPLLRDETGTLDLHYLRSEKGLSRARNVGISHARAGLVGFPDDDCWYPADCVARILILHGTHGKAAIIAGRTLDAQGRPSLSASHAEPGRITYRNALKAGNSNTLFVTADALASVGGFDERLGVGAGTPFQSSEETDLVIRILKNGHEGEYFPDLVIHHDQNAGGEEELARVRKYAVGAGAFLRKNGYGVTGLSKLLIKTLGGIPLRAARGRDPQIKLKFVYMRSVLRGFFLWDTAPDVRVKDR
jgi:GT2 family glycosyltransferase